MVVEKIEMVAGLAAVTVGCEDCRGPVEWTTESHQLCSTNIMLKYGGEEVGIRAKGLVLCLDCWETRA